jgi:predicted TIM-barrel fold metal-dependent hydrolase
MEEARPFQDFVMHHIVRRAIDHDLTIQIHTGIQEGNGNEITNSDPTLLSNLFLEYPEARFDLFHGSYPYWRELGLLAKVFPNVYADMCWVPTISPRVLRVALEEWIELIPSTKVSAFGADYIFVDGSYAASRMARRAVTEALCVKVEEGYLEEDEGAGLAAKYLRENAWALFGLDRWRRQQRKRPARAKARRK